MRRVVSWLLAGAVQAAGGQTPPPAPQRIQIEGKAQDDSELRRDALAGLVVVDREELDRYGDFSVLDVLQRQAGISVDGGEPRLRGLGGGYTLILINGEPAPPGFSLEQLSPAEIERIEIIKGPSAEHGGVAGTINVILRGAPKLRQREWRANASYRGLRPVGSTSLSWGDRVGALGFQVPIAAYQWAGRGAFRSERLSRSAEGELREQHVQGRDEWRGGGLNLGPRLDWKVSDFDTLQWQTFLQRNESDNRNVSATAALQGTPPSLLAVRSENRGVWQLARTQLQWVSKQPDGRRYELKASAERSRGDSAGLFFGTAGSAAPLLRESVSHSTSDRIALGARWRQPLADGHALASGIDAEQRSRHELRSIVDNGVEWLTGSIGRPFDAQMRRGVAFVQDDWTISQRASASIGLRLEAIATEAGTSTGDVERQRSVMLSPAVQGRWALDDKSRDVLRASLARSSRLPDLSSLIGRYSFNGSYERNTSNTPIAADSGGNPHLLPERAWAFELSWEQYFSGGGVASLGLFHRRIERLIRRRLALEAVPESSVARWVSRPANIGQARSTGVELELKGTGEQLLPMLFVPRSGWQLRAATSLYGSQVEQIDDPDARLEGQPPWVVTLGVDKLPAQDALGCGTSLSYTPSYTTQQTDRQRLWRDRVRRLDVYALWRFSREVQLRVSVSNADPLPTRSETSIEDLDGFSARSSTRREGLAQFNANLIVRF